MSEAKPPGPDAEKLAKELQAALVKRRPTTWKPVLALLGFCTLILVLLAWTLKPRPALPLLPLVALDSVYTPDETPLARIQLYKIADAEVARNVAGQDILFQGPEFVEGNRKSTMIRVTTDARGQATAQVAPNPTQAQTEFQARHVEKGTPDSGQVFIWPREAKLLTVDVDETALAKEPNPEAIATLKKATEAQWRIVYLSVASANAGEYQRTRNGLQELADLPVGPVVGRPFYPGRESIEQARDEALRSFDRRFTGAKCIIVQSSQAAERCVAQRWRTILIGNAKAPAEVIRVPSWAEVFEQLK